MKIGKRLRKREQQPPPWNGKKVKVLLLEKNDAKAIEDGRSCGTDHNIIKDKQSISAQLITIKRVFQEFIINNGKSFKNIGMHQVQGMVLLGWLHLSQDAKLKISNWEVLLNKIIYCSLSNITISENQIFVRGWIFNYLAVSFKTLCPYSYPISPRILN